MSGTEGVTVGYWTEVGEEETGNGQQGEGVVVGKEGPLGAEGVHGVERSRTRTGRESWGWGRHCRVSPFSHRGSEEWVTSGS